MRALNESETTDYLAGYATYEGAVETEDGILVPESLYPFQMCSANRGGDPASGCENEVQPGSDYCSIHQEER